MTSDFPTAGQVFDYHFLWKWQEKLGETEGRKKRASCVALVAANAKGQHVLFIAPITSKEPSKDRAAIEIPEMEARRAKLDTDIPLWITVDEINTDILEASYVLEDRTPRGQFSAPFTDLVINDVRAVRQAGKLSVSKRD